MKRSGFKRKIDPQAQLKKEYREAKKTLQPVPTPEQVKWKYYPTKRNKYGAVKTQCHDILHDSKLEAGHAKELRLAQKAGLIRDLEFQKDFVLTVNGKQICIYIADFVYFHIGDNRLTIADSKGKETAVFRLKWRLTQALYPDYSYILFKNAWIHI